MERDNPCAARCSLRATSQRKGVVGCRMGGDTATACLSFLKGVRAAATGTLLFLVPP